MTKPVIENIADNVLDTINGITIANGYNYNLSAVRKRRIDFEDEAWDDLSCLILQTKVNELDSGYSTKEWEQFFEVFVFAQDPDDSDISIDTKLNQIRSDIEKAIMTDTTRGGFAIDTMIHGAVFDDDNGYSAVAVSFSVHYRVNELNPYTQS